MTTPSQSKLPVGIHYVRTLAGVSEYRLDNGLQILLNVDPATPAPVGAEIVYRVGSKHENYGETGMAHALEHMVFKQSVCDSCNVLYELQLRALELGATTAFDCTLYLANFAADDRCLDNLSWFMTWQANTMNQQAFLAQHRLDREKTVVRNEEEISQDDDMAVLQSSVLAGLFDWHNYGNSIGGAASDVANMDAGRLAAFYRRHYRPDNACLFFSGQIEAGQLLELVARHLGPVERPSEPLPAPLPTVEPPPSGEREVTVRRPNLSRPMLVAAYRGPGVAHPHAPALSALVNVLQTRLQRSPLGKAGKIEIVTTLPMAEAGVVMFQALRPLPGATLEQARATLLAQIENQDPVSAQELEAACAQLASAVHPFFVDGKLPSFDALIYYAGLGDWRVAAWRHERLAHLTPDQVTAAAKLLLQPHRRCVGILLPDEQLQEWPAVSSVDLDAWTADAQMAAPVVAAKPGIGIADLEAGATRIQLGNGMRVGLYEQTDASGVVAFLRFDQIDTGVRHQVLLPFLLQQLVHPDSFTAVSGVRVRTSVSHLRLDIGVIADSPADLADALELLFRQLARSAKLTLSECQHLLNSWTVTKRTDESKALWPCLSGATYMLDDIVAQTDLHQLLSSLQGALAASREWLGVYGAFDASVLRHKLQAVGDLLPVEQPEAPVEPDTLADLSAENRTVRMPHAKTAMMVATIRAPAAGLPDYPALKFASLLLERRLAERIREQEGLSYTSNILLGRQSLFTQWKRPLRQEPEGKQLDDTQCRQDSESAWRWRYEAYFAPQNRARAEQCFDETLALARTQGFREQELQAGKGYYAAVRWYQVWQNQLPIPVSEAEMLAQLLATGVAVDHDPHHYDRLAALTLDEVNAALRRYLDPARMQREFYGEF